MKRCMNCGNPFFNRVIKLDNFCSIKCKHSFNNKKLKENEDWMDKQANMDVQAKQKAKADDYRILRR